MENLVLSEFKLGIIAGGQLGKMLSLAASTWNIKTYILDPDEDCPAVGCCNHFVKGDFLDFDTVYRFGKMVDMITFELENVNIEALKQLKAEGLKISPDPEILELIKDKGRQKEFYSHHEIPTAPFKLFNNKGAIMEAINDGNVSFPFVQKLRTGGYDGKGVEVIKSFEDFTNLMNGPSLIEDKVNIQKELSIIVARNAKGDIQCFPAVEMEFNGTENLVERLICPANIDDSSSIQCMNMAKKIIQELNMVGLLAVEMFVTDNNEIIINEIAPRPHNSGHHTIESVITSQFEQLLRAIFNLSLGSTNLKIPAVMINLLGSPGYQGKVKYEGLTECMAIEGVKIHLYGKKITKPYRKMGHVTIISQSIKDAIIKSEIVKQKLKVIA